MRRRMQATTFGLALAAALLLGGLTGYAVAPEPASAQACDRPGYVRGGSCRASERDAVGCCPPVARPTRRRRRRAVAPQRHGWGGVPECSAGLVSSEDTSNRCCWPGQYWIPSPGRCGGAPRCPAGQVAQDDGDCGCAPGRVRNANTRGNCCWPSQVWVPSQSACVGEPRCGEGFVRAGSGCEVQAVAGAPSGPATPARSDIVSAMRGVAGAVRACGNGTHGVAPVRIVFSIVFSGSNGRVTSAQVSGGRFPDPVSRCIARAVRDARVPPFRQSSFTFNFPFSL